MSQSNDQYDRAYFLGHYGRIINDPAYYNLLAKYWAKAVFEGLESFGCLDQKSMLDYGSGTGVVTAALRNSVCFDVSSYAREFLLARGRQVFSVQAEIPKASFELLLCSHSLEHYPNPKEVLEQFKDYVLPGGYLLLILPIETDFSPTITPDSNQHFYGWNFQNLSNLLLHCGWTPCQAQEIYGPFLLGSLGRTLPDEWAIAAAYALGRIKRGFRSLRMLAKLTDAQRGSI